MLVVADRFSSFVHDERVSTVSNLVAALTRGDFDQLTRDVQLYGGQGVDRFERDYVRAAIDRRGLSGRVRFADHEVAPAGRDVVHKSSSDNVLLAGVRRTGQDEYVAEIRVHGNNELLQDHQTGEHVQGMVIVEAVRQMFLGVFEVGYRHRWPLTMFYVVWNDVRLKFDNFLFPLPAQIHCIVRELSVDRPERQLDFALDVEVLQDGKVVASGEVGFSSFNDNKMALLERRKATKAISNRLAAVAGTT